MGTEEPGEEPVQSGVLPLSRNTPIARGRQLAPWDISGLLCFHILLLVFLLFLPLKHRNSLFLHPP